MSFLSFMCLAKSNIIILSNEIRPRAKGLTQPLLVVWSKKSEPQQSFTVSPHHCSP